MIYVAFVCLFACSSVSKSHKTTDRIFLKILPEEDLRALKKISLSTSQTIISLIFVLFLLYFMLI